MTDLAALITWLRTQIDADELAARQAAARGAHMARHDSARVLREVDSKRALIEAVERRLDPHPGQPCTNEGPESYEACDLHVEWMKTAVNPYALRLLALAYADLPGYLEEWAP